LPLYSPILNMWLYPHLDLRVGSSKST